MMIACHGSEFGDVVATSQSLAVEDAVAFDDSVAAIRRHMEDGTSNENLFEVCRVALGWEVEGWVGPA